MIAGTMSGASFLLADLGGTNVRFALAQPEAAAPLLLQSVRAYRVAGFGSLAQAARSYLDALAAQPLHAVIAVAGRVQAGQVQMTNHAWSISAAQLQDELRLDRVQLVNDFGAVGMSLPLLSSRDLVALGPPVNPLAAGEAPQTFCMLGPGTGLGVAALAVRGEQVFGLQTEGGHGSFAPTTEEEIALLRHLIGRFGRVSDERLLCGSGLVNVQQALCASADRADRVHSPAAALTPEEITTRARRGTDAQCVRAVELFCEILGSVAGDLALIYGAWDGVYLAGGLTASLRPWLEDGRFRRRFNDKGRFSSEVSRIPVAIITHPQPGLLGAAGFAVLASGRPLLRSGERGQPESPT